MKKLLILPITIILALFSMSFTKPDEVLNQRAVSAFQSEFTEANAVSWKQYDLFSVATFRMHDQVLFAYYDRQGSLIALGHNMLTTELPTGLRKELKKRYSDFWITDCFLMRDDDGTHYFVQVNNPAGAQILTSDGVESWKIYLRTRLGTKDL